MNEVKVEPINDFIDAKVGDLVTCLMNGVGVVSGVRRGDIYPIQVDYKHREDYEYYTSEGKIHEEDIKPCLYKGHVDFRIEVIKPKVKKYLVAYKRKGREPEITNGKYISLEDFEKRNYGWHERAKVEWSQLIEASMELCDE